MQDIQLIERCLGGEEAAWEDLVKVHTRRVYAICYRFTSSDQEAQDLTQEVFLRVFRSLKSFRAGEGSFTVWLARLTRNLLIDHYRRSKLERATDSIEEQLPMIEETRAMSARTDGLLAGREASEVLQGALQKLSPELRETVILRDLEELEYREIAQVLNVPEGTVKSRLEPRPRGTGPNPAEAEGRDMTPDLIHGPIDELLRCRNSAGRIRGWNAPRGAKSAVESHLAACAACRELAEDAAAAVAFMARTAAVEAPPELVTRILFQVPAMKPSAGAAAVRTGAGRMAGAGVAARLAMGMAWRCCRSSCCGRRCAN